MSLSIPQPSPKLADINQLTQVEIEDIINHIVESSLVGISSKQKVMVFAMGASLNGKSTSLHKLIIPALEHLHDIQPRDMSAFVDYVRKGYIYPEYQDLLQNLSDDEVLARLRQDYHELNELVSDAGIVTACVDYCAYALPRTRCLLGQGHKEAIHEVYMTEALWEPWKLLTNTITTAIDRGLPIVVDSTGSRLPYMKDILSYAQKHDYQTILLVLNSDMDVVIERAKKRMAIRSLNLEQVKRSNAKTSRQFPEIINIAEETGTTIALLDTTDGYHFTALAGARETKNLEIIQTMLELKEFPESEETTENNVLVFDKQRFQSFTVKESL